jgi:ribosomal-protein-alanine N-acetyltransferase
MLNFNFSPFPVLETDRLILRQLTLDDAKDMLRMRSKPETMRYIPRPVMQTIDEALALIQLMNDRIAANDNINWAVTLKGEDKMIGFIGYPRISKEDHRGEIGYLLDPDYHRRGITFEALAPIFKYGFEVMGFHTIEAVIDPGNTASENLLIKYGFAKEAHFRENLLFDNRWLDSVHYTLFRK